MNVRDLLWPKAFGPCIMCGKESQGSMYWIGMTEENWKVLRPHVGELNENEYSFTPDRPPEERAMNMFFVEGLCQPLCGPVCALEHSNG